MLETEADEQSEELKVSLETEPIEFTDKKLVTVTLKGYDLDLRHIPLEGKDREVIKKFCKKDPLQLLEYWSVDFQYDGKIHNPQFSFPKEKDRIEKVCRQIGYNINKISIRAVDVFGNSTLTILQAGV